MSLNTPQSFKLTTPHFAVIGLGVVIFVALFFVERTPPLDNKKSVSSTDAGHNVPQSAENAKPTAQNSAQPLTFADLPELTDAQKSVTDNLKKLSESKSKKDSLAILPLIVQSALESGRFDYAAFYQELGFNLNPTDTALKSTAKYFKQSCDLYRAENRTELAEKARLKAVMLYEQYLQKNTNDTDTKIDLAILHVESPQPMTGIQHLVQIAQQQPSNYRAQLELGIFSLNTSQLAKAEERLLKVVSIKPDKWEGHYYLGLAYRQGQKNKEAKSSFEKAKKYAKDRVILDEIENQMKSLP